MTAILLPEVSLVALIGISGSGKSTFARRHFTGTSVLSSDAFRALVADDENDQSASADAFAALHFVAGRRLAAGRRTIVDATNVQKHARAELVRVAREHDVLPVAIVLDVPVDECWTRTQARPDRDFGQPVLTRQHRDLRRSLGQLAKEGFRKVYVLRGVEEIESATVGYEKLFNDRRELTGPFDIIGDVHGCRAELEELLTRLGWVVTPDGATHPAGRTAVFVGDLVDRGPDSPGVVRLVMGMVRAGTALCVTGNHEAKLLRALRGAKVRVSHGLGESLEQFGAADPAFVAEAVPFLESLISHYVLDGGRLAVAHAGIKEAYQGRASGRVRAFCLYGETTGETDEYGLPVRHPWANEYRGRATVVYGHVPTPVPEWVNNTICIDTGCVFGGSLTALRYPERELVQVPAREQYYDPIRPLAPPASPTARPDAINLADVTGRRSIETAYGRITVDAEHAAAALEVMSRFAVDPRWLLWLPPTMAPCSTSKVDGYLEHPVDALADYRRAGVTRVVCQEKHMGSRAVVVLCRDEEAGRRRFGADGGGAVYTRTGRPFFPDAAPLLERLRAAADRSGVWDELHTDWLLLDGEVLPWSAKALPLIRDQYANVGAAGNAALPAALSAVDAALARGLDVGGVRERLAGRAERIGRFVDVYRRYCWTTDGLDGIRFAPFHMLASEGATHADRDHAWHLGVVDRLVDGFVVSTDRLELDLDDPGADDAATAWWLALTDGGGEGMVVKPLTPGGRGVPTMLKCRGREYLRIIYGPDYTEPARLEALRGRRLGRKRGLAQREHALGLAALDALATGGPLWRIHQLVFAILACESEPVDPRL